MPNIPRPRVHTGIGWRFWALATIFLAATFISGFGGAWLQNKYDEDRTASVTEQKKIVTSESRLINQIANQVGPSVVSVNVDITSSASSDLYDVFGIGEPTQPQQAQAAGTGIILSDSGVVVTNRHVVPSGATSVSVTLSDGTELKDVSIIGRTNTNDSLDVAFLKINDKQGHQLKAASIGDSSKILVGDNVVAIGNALGQFQNSVTSGIISGFGRSVVAGDSSGASKPENLDNLIQTDAAINEGNSGGPLVNMNGEVIGINTAIAGDAQNIGFAIPINDVSGLIKQVLKTGKFARPYLGVRYIALSADIAQKYSLKVNQGAFIVPSEGQASPSILRDSPADTAGLKEKDVIISVNNKKVDQANGLTSLLGRHIPGDVVSLTVLRGSKTIQIKATLGTMPASQ